MTVQDSKVVLLNISVKWSMNFLRSSLKAKRKLGPRFFPDLFLMKSGYHKDINGKERKKFDELLCFPAFHFGSIFLRVMVPGQYARQSWLNLCSLILYIVQKSFIWHREVLLK